MLKRRLGWYIAALCMIGASFTAHANGTPVPEMGSQHVPEIGTSVPAAGNPLPPLFDTLEERR